MSTAKALLEIADKCPVLDDLDLTVPPVRAANAVLVELGMRRGFDHWFDNLDDEIREEIVFEVAEVIEAVFPIPRELTQDEINEIVDKAVKDTVASALQHSNQPVKDYCAEQVYVVTPHKSEVHNQPQGNRAMSDIKKNVLDLAAAIQAEMKIGEAGIVEVSGDLYNKLLPETLTPEIVKAYQDHTTDLVAGTAEALANIAIPAFQADEKLEQLSVEFGCGSDSLAGTIQRSKDYPAGGIPKEGEVRDPNATVTKYGIVSMKYGVNAHSNKGSLKKVRDGINKRAAEALAKA
jgi:hypothetical protein